MNFATSHPSPHVRCPQKKTKTKKRRKRRKSTFDPWYCKFHKKRKEIL
uniref:Uncharacterized protein n=1 Tax=Anguilla anguilla TaxID=7936 RepID=A0A0E9W3P5_ANGAN